MATTHINKYATQAAYAADKDRATNQSTTSLISATNKTMFGGVNTMAPLSNGGYGDLVVYDSDDGTLKVLKAGTIVKAQMGANLTAMAVVILNKGKNLFVISLEDTSLKWAYPYEVALQGLDLANGGSFTIKLDGTSVTYSFSAGATLAQVAATMNADSTNFTSKYWSATATASQIIITGNAARNSSTAQVVAVSGCSIVTRQIDKDYQNAYVGDLPNGNSLDENKRANGVIIYYAGACKAKFSAYYAANGTTATNVPEHSPTILNSASFNAADNPVLYKKYNGSYYDYIIGEHFSERPSQYGALSRDGKTNTKILAAHTFVDIYGNTQDCYPAAAYCNKYAKTISGKTLGLEAGNWWLPSNNELVEMFKDLKIDRTDAVNQTLSAIGATLLYFDGYYWSSCERYSNHSYIYDGDDGTLGDDIRRDEDRVRPVSALSF
jgi:hypothetical protein